MVIGRIAEILGVETDDLEMEFGPSDVDGWDSHASMNIVVGIEQLLDTQIELDDLAEMTTVRDIVNVVSRYNDNQL
jgi:acyl carrier protein